MSVYILRFFTIVVMAIVLFFLYPHSISASEDNSFITIVNPVRISSYTKDPAQSLQAEYDEVRKRDLPATWLLTYDAIASSSLSAILSSMDAKQELGIFLEVTENFSKNSGVSYNKTDSWHRATSLFLSGYKHGDRTKLIDTVFDEFKKKFRYYPKSVGAWWVDAFSLSYMKRKYGITGVLGISDQYDLDGYQVWGTLWSMPFYPGKIHAGMPASSPSSKLDIVTFRWAARDPLNGYYGSPRHTGSLYSLQDFSTIELPLDYYRELLKLYSIQKQFNEFGQITMGLEADYSPETYSQNYAGWLDVAKNLEEQGVNVSTMREFSEWYRKNFPKLSPPHFIQTDDILGKPKKAIWYQSSFYRMGFVYDYGSQKLQIIDFRPYLNNFQEPFYISPNKQFNLSINLPFVIDSANDRNSLWEIDTGTLQSISRDGKDIKIQFDNGWIVFWEDELLLSKSIPIPSNIKNSKLVTVKYSQDVNSIVPNKNFYVPEEGLTISDFSLNIPFAVKSRLGKLYPISIFFGVLIIVSIVISNKKYIKKYSQVILVILVILAGIYIFIKSNIKYYISQSEVDSLSILRRLPKGRVLVYDKDCLRCTFEIRYKPAAASGVKNYVKRLSGKEILNDFSFSIAQTSQKARKILEDKNIDYVYLVKYEDYIEHLPYLPQDLDLERIYQNANTEIYLFSK